MKKLLSLLIAFLLLYDVSAQNIELSFTGVVDQSYITLDSIKIMNRTKDCDTLLVYPDTVLSLTVVGFNHYQSEICDKSYPLGQKSAQVNVHFKAS